MPYFFSLNPQASLLPTPLLPPLLQIVSVNSPDWTSPHFRRLFKATYYHQGIAASTHKTYSVGIQNFISFCTRIHSLPIPASEQTLLFFITHLGQLNLSHKTIKVYLSAVRHLHTTSGHFKAFESQLSPI